MNLRLLSSSLCVLSILYHLNLILWASNATANSFTNETDRQALLAIKDQIQDDPLRVFLSWNNSLHFCHWQGVTCGHRHQRVIMLNLSSLSLVGSVSPSIGNLTFLRAIHLENNSFQSTIPQELGRLFRLQNLSLHNNSFQGEFPTNLTHCSDIRIISLSENNIGGKIPRELGSMSNLLKLYLSKNHFTGMIPPSFGNLSALQLLSLAYNNLEGSIPFELGRLLNLNFLQLSWNNLSGMVPTLLFNISSINIFSVAVNQLNGSLPPDLGLTLPKLQRFYFGENQFSGHVPPSITNASKLVVFDIISNAFAGPVSINFGSLDDLERLALGTNALGSNQTDDFSFLINSLSNCSNLRELLLDYNGFRGVMSSSIANMSTKLVSLSLHHNYISGNIPQGIGNLINLQRLSLDENLLTGSIPDSIGKLSELQVVYMHSNNISGKIPSSIGNITQVSVLNLRDNMLEGSIPVSLGDCKQLRVLFLSHNKLTGAIPKQLIGHFSLLIALYLDHNHLIGPLPPQVGNLKNLEQLYLSRNKLSGEIPSTLGDCLVLEFLYMDGNLFEGTIPTSFQKLKGIQDLDLSHNNLSGYIPRFLGDFPFIQNLNLSYNMFEGEVPNEGALMNVSVFSVVGNNRVCGGIKALKLPACPAKVSNKERKLSARKMIVLITGIILFVILLLASVCAILYCIRRTKGKHSSDYSFGIQYPKLSYAELLQATNEFSSTNLIGEGRYGSVYKGILNSGEQTVAVKVLNLQQHGANKSFMAECEALRNIRHRNLVKIITSCSSIDFKGNDFKALIFEFMPNGSLESWLHPNLTMQQDPRNLNLVQRLNIAIDVASALDYLHHHCETTVIHCDLKPSNVLLDDDLCAHVGDFGLAKFLLAPAANSNHTQSSSVGIRGTVGYVAPEYGMGSVVSTQGDVYSYGILLLEMFTGRRPTNNMFTDNFGLHNYAKLALPDRVMEIVDQKLILEEEDESNQRRQSSRHNIAQVETCLASILRIGVVCSVELPSARMNVRDVLMEMHTIRNIFLGVGRERERERERERGNS